MVYNGPAPTTLQEVFDRVWNHCIVQKHPRCVTGVCSYRSQNRDNACWIGCLVPDKQYSIGIEHKCLSLALADVKMTSLCQTFGSQLEELRRIHDGYCEDNRKWFEYAEKELRKFALAYKLKITN